MKWVTLSHVHLDRAAVPWLIRRFVDADAEFAFVMWGEDGTIPQRGSIDVPDGAIGFGLPGVELGLHDESGTCFAKVLRTYSLDDPALWQVERLVAAGVRHTFGQPPAPDETAEETMLGASLDLIGHGLGVAFDDDAHLAAALTLYDAVYAHCRLEQLPLETREGAPFLPPQRTPYLRAALGPPYT